MTTSRSPIKSRQGFTLIEVLVTMSIFSILIPSVLAVSLHLARSATNGVEHTSTIAEARHLQQFFIRSINAGKGFSILDDGNKVVLPLYNATSGAWENAILAFSETDRSLTYYPPAANGVAHVLSTHAYRNNKRKIFSADGSGLRLDLYLGPQDPMSEEKINGTVRAPGVFVDLTATPRNTGLINED